MLEIGVQSKEVNFHIQGKWVLDFAGCWAYKWSKACGLLCLCSYFKRRARARCPLFFFFFFFHSVSKLGFVFVFVFLKWCGMLCRCIWPWASVSAWTCHRLWTIWAWKNPFWPQVNENLLLLLLLLILAWCWYIWSLILLIFSYFSPLLKSITSRADVDHAMIEEDLEERQDFIAALESRFLFLASDARSTLR